MTCLPRRHSLGCPWCRSLCVAVHRQTPPWVCAWPGPGLSPRAWLLGPLPAPAWVFIRQTRTGLFLEAGAGVAQWGPCERPCGVSLPRLQGSGHPGGSWRELRRSPTPWPQEWGASGQSPGSSRPPRRLCVRLEPGRVLREPASCRGTEKDVCPRPPQRQPGVGVGAERTVTRGGWPGLRFPGQT